jgi:hemerythrin
VALIVWTNAMSVGVDILDADHIIIASLINHIDDAKQSGTDESAEFSAF